MPLSKVLTWNGISSAAVPHLVIGEIVRDPVGRIRTAFMEIPGVEGAYVFPQRRGQRKIRAEMSIDAPDKDTLMDSLEDFSTWVDIEGQAKLATSDNPGVYYEATLEDVEMQTEWRGLAKFTTIWTVQPFSLSDTVTTEAWVSDSNETHNWVPDTGVRVYPVITITPTDGILEGFELTTNGSTLTFDGGMILSGQSITINSIAGVVVSGVNADSELVGVYDPNNLALQYVTGDFPELINNVSNSIQFYETLGNATVINISVKFRKKFRR